MAIRDIVAGMLALLLGPVQFWLGLTMREKLLHRILGGAYVLAVLCSGGAALYLATHTDFGWVFGMGLAVMSLAWIASTAISTISILLHSVEQHREWMIRSYVLTFGFVTFRIFIQALQVAGVGTTLEQMTAAGVQLVSPPSNNGMRHTRTENHCRKTAPCVREKERALQEPAIRPL
jgi:hypothetical protein